jgi:L-asparaginase
MPSNIVILGTGGTIAGAASNPSDNVGYTAGQRSVGDLLAAVPDLQGLPIEWEQVAQLDSKDMDHATWQRLAQRAAHHLAREDVAGVVVTHGTDTLEETAWFLQRVLAPAKPLVLVAAMRPASALSADGPANLRDAVAVVRSPGARGVLAVLAGAVHAAGDVRKVHSYRLDAFDSGDAGPLARVEEGRLRRFKAWPEGQALGLDAIAADAARWPWVAVVPSHAGARGEAVDALVAAGVRGLVVACTGNGSLHHALADALARAVAAGVPVRRTSRCAQGVLVESADISDDGAAAALPAAQAATPWQARVDLMLDLLHSD